jgi:hypothetical protein
LTEAIEARSSLPAEHASSVPEVVRTGDWLFDGNLAPDNLEGAGRCVAVHCDLCSNCTGACTQVQIAKRLSTECEAVTESASGVCPVLDPASKRQVISFPHICVRAYADIDGGRESSRK